jgi:capsid portal protein
VHILKTGVERFLCGLLQYILKKYVRQIDFQDIYFREFKEKRRYHQQTATMGSSRSSRERSGTGTPSLLG